MRPLSELQKAAPDLWSGDMNITFSLKDLWVGLSYTDWETDTGIFERRYTMCPVPCFPIRWQRNITPKNCVCINHWELAAADHYWTCPARGRRCECERPGRCLKTEHQKEIESLNIANEVQVKELEKTISQRETAYDRNRWLIEGADGQREKIDEYVVLEEVHFYEINKERVPRIIFHLKIRNKSFLEIKVGEDISGAIMFDTVSLKGSKYFYGFTSILPSNTEWVRLAQDLPQEQLEYIEKFIANDSDAQRWIERYFSMKHLKIKIQGNDESLKVTEKELRISGDFKILDSAKVAKANEEYEY